MSSKIPDSQDASLLSRAQRKAEGKAEGQKEERIRIARLLLDKLSVEEVSQVTGLTVDEVEQLNGVKTVNDPEIKPVGGGLSFAFSGCPKSYAPLYKESYEEGFKLSCERGHPPENRESFAECFAIGKRRGRVERVRLMLAAHPIEEISRVTKLSVSDIEKLRDS